MRYSWKQMPGEYQASYYNKEDYEKGKTFCIVDNFTKREYVYPRYEKRVDAKGKMYSQRVIDRDLWNQEFMTWACETAPDFASSVPDEFLDRELIFIVLNHGQEPDFIRRVPNNILSLDMCLLSVRKMPKSFYCIPSKFRTSQMYEIAYFNDLIQFDVIPVMHLTQNICEDYILKNPNRVEFVPEKYRSVEYIHDLIDKNPHILMGIPTKYYRQKDYEKAYFENIIDFEKIPDLYLTNKICNDLLTKNIDNISLIPERFQNPELVKEIIEQRPRLIGKIAKKYLTFSLITLAVTLDAQALAFVPPEYRTKKLCELAVFNGCSLFYVPSKHRDYDLCKIGVINHPSQIKFVPLSILNQAFYDELIELGVRFGKKEMQYIEKCLNLNAPFQRVQKSNEPGEVKDYSAFANIELNSLEGFFNSSSLQLLNNNDIFTLEDLFVRSSSPSFINIFTISKNSFERQYHEILGNIKLLKCKYLNEPLVIDLDLPIAEFVKIMGFGTRASRSLIGSSITTGRELLEAVKNNDEKRILRVYRIGESTLKEIMEKCSIVLENLDRDSGENELNALIEELKELTNARDIANEQISIIQQKILEKAETIQKGGVTK